MNGSDDVDRDVVDVEEAADDGGEQAGGEEEPRMREPDDQPVRPRRLGEERLRDARVRGPSPASRAAATGTTSSAPAARPTGTR